MEKKVLLIAMSALFLLTCATSCNNGKSANNKNATEKVDKDATVRDFITNMYENKPQC